MPQAGCAGFGIVAVLLLAARAEAQFYGSYELDPKTYRSPSGKVTLHVDPGKPSGAGPAKYRCERDGKALWSGERPYTLWNAELTDDGRVAGYGFAAGYMGGREDALFVVLLAPDGRALLEERTPREGVYSDIGSPDPMVAGLFVDPENERFVVRTSSGGSFASSEAWWTYSLATGEPGPRLDPRASTSADERASGIGAARPVPGTKLVLVQQEWLDFDSDHYGAVFTLLEREGRSVWHVDWLDDYTVHGDWEASERVLDEVREKSVILAVEPGRFTLRQVATNERVTFAIEHVTGAREGWDVKEVARAPFVEEKPPEGTEAPQPAALHLAHLGSIALGAEPQKPVVRDLMTFALDGLGRLGFVRRTGDDERSSFDFVRVDREGENAVEIPLPPPPAGEWWQYELAWTQGDRWVVTGSEMQKQPHAWWLDAASRSASPIEGFTGPTIGSVAGTADGGFVVLGTTWYESGYLTSDLAVFGPDGVRRFALGGDQGNPRDPSTLFAPEALTVRANGEIVIVSNIQKTLQFFSATGEFLRVVKLADLWGREPRYPTEVRNDVGGGLLVRDQGSPSIVRMDEAGRVTSAFDVHYADGRAEPRCDVWVGPDGALWDTDGHALLQLDAQGTVQRTLGSAPDARVLGHIASVVVGPGDRLYAADGWTGAVHVFDAGGRLERVCVPEPGDFSGSTGLMSLAVSDAGEIQVGGVRFAPDGTRLGKQRGQRALHAQHGTDRWWSVGYKALSLLAADGSVVREIQRAPDGKWLRDLGGAGVAPDGSLALVTGDGSTQIHLFDASGEPLRSFAGPDGIPSWTSIAFDGQRLALPIEAEDRPGAVVLLDARGRTLGTFAPEGEVPLWRPSFAANGRELWLFDGARRVERFALP